MEEFKKKRDGEISRKDARETQNRQLLPQQTNGHLLLSSKNRCKRSDRVNSCEDINREYSSPLRNEHDRGSMNENASSSDCFVVK